MMRITIYLGFALVLLCGTLSVRAQKQVPLSYTDYLEQVSRNNLEYAAEKLNVDIAAAGIQAAKVFHDPGLSVEYSNNQERKLRMGYGVSAELSKTISLGKRSAAIGLAESEYNLTEALLADYFRNLRVEATLSYIDALKQHRLYQVKEDAWQNVRKLAEGDSVRFALGKITEVDAVQSKLEAGMLYNELQQAATELQNVFTGLSLMTGNFQPDTLFVPESSWSKPEQKFVLSSLLDTALVNRTDLIVVQKNVDVAKSGLKVAKRERNMDIDLAVGVSKNARVRNEEAPAPPFTGVTASVGIPLPFSNLYKGGIKAAGLKQQQSEIQYHQAEIQVQTEVMQAYRQYQSLQQQVGHYENGLLEQAGQVIKGKIYSYSRGETSLLEVLNAQRTYDEVRSSYIEALFNFTVALVELERCAGIWDIQL